MRQSTIDQLASDGLKPDEIIAIGDFKDVFRFGANTILTYREAITLWKHYAGDANVAAGDYAGTLQRLQSEGSNPSKKTILFELLDREYEEHDK